MVSDVNPHPYSAEKAGVPVPEEAKAEEEDEDVGTIIKRRQPRASAASEVGRRKLDPRRLESTPPGFQSLIAENIS